jgi:hypothetical protein
MIATILLPAAGMLLLASPAAPFLALYRWDTSTWPDRTAHANVQRVDLRRDTIPPPPGRLARLRHAHHGRPA